jgi:hypothetical protein
VKPDMWVASISSFDAQGRWHVYLEDRPARATAGVTDVGPLMVAYYRPLVSALQLPGLAPQLGLSESARNQEHQPIKQHKPSGRSTLWPAATATSSGIDTTQHDHALAVPFAPRYAEDREVTLPHSCANRTRNTGVLCAYLVAMAPIFQ